MEHEKCNKYLVSVCYVLDTVLGAWNEPLNKTAEDPCPRGAYIV